MASAGWRVVEPILKMRWPLIAFDADLYPYLIKELDLKEDRFETILAEEIVAAFDRDYYPVGLRPSRSGKHVIAEMGQAQDIRAWSEVCRASLLRAWPKRDVAKLGREVIGTLGPEGLRESILLLV
jgi:hypothetical protein